MERSMMSKKIQHEKLRVFEAFAGIGAQASALKRMKINYEIVGIDCNALIKQHGSLHCITMQFPKNVF